MVPALPASAEPRPNSASDSSSVWRSPSRAAIQVPSGITRVRPSMYRLLVQLSCATEACSSWPSAG
ncbi:hypothetical protein D3C72_2054000 [compost metagenome]